MSSKKREGRNTWANTQVVLWKTLARLKNNLKYARYIDRSCTAEFGDPQTRADD